MLNCRCLKHQTRPQFPGGFPFPGNPELSHSSVSIVHSPSNAIRRRGRSAPMTISRRWMALTIAEVRIGVHQSKAMLLHSILDCLAIVSAALIYRWGPRWQSGGKQSPFTTHPLYWPLASIGATIGAYLLGTANLWLSGVHAVGRSIEGGLAGAILAFELLKRQLGIHGSTGLRLVLPLAVAILIGRIGCFLAGLDDMTYGTPTELPWGVDFGDGIARHPVQLYESAAIAIFIAGFLYLARTLPLVAMRSGFYLFVFVYAAQRFLWEFLKPYGVLLGPLNLFHLLSIGLMAYAAVFAYRAVFVTWPLRPT